MSNKSIIPNNLFASKNRDLAVRAKSLLQTISDRVYLYTNSFNTGRASKLKQNRIFATKYTNYDIWLICKKGFLLLERE